jgi:hypothetical protein
MRITLSLWIIGLCSLSAGCELVHIATRNLLYEMALYHENADHPADGFPFSGPCPDPIYPPGHPAPNGPVHGPVHEPVHELSPESVRPNGQEPKGSPVLPYPKPVTQGPEDQNPMAELAPPARSLSQPPQEPSPRSTITAIRELPDRAPPGSDDSQGNGFTK